MTPAHRTARRTALACLVLPLAAPALATALETESASAPPPSLEIRWHQSPEERRARVESEALRRSAIAPAVATWQRRLGARVVALERAHLEAQRTLAHGAGPTVRNSGYPIEVELRRLATAALLPAPDPALDRAFRAALGALFEGAIACQRGLPTVAQLRLAAGKRRLDEVRQRAAAWGR